MRISMWILADWLAAYDPEVKIQQGERVLRNARLFSDDLKISKTTVYLDQIQRDLVLCSSGHDFLVLHADDVNEVFNDVLDAFEFYDEWSGDAYDLIARGCSARELLSFGTQLLRRALILADATFYMREICDPEGIVRRASGTWNAEENRVLPLEALLGISALAQIRIPDLPTYRVDPPGVEPGAAVTNLFLDGVHQGWLITVSEAGAYGQGDLDLQDAFCEVLAAWMEHNRAHDERMEKSGIFLELLENGAQAGAHIEERLKAFGWYPSDQKQIYVIEQRDSSMDPTHAMERYLERVNEYAFVIHYDGRILYIINRQITPAEPFEETLRQTLRRCGCAAAKSPVFTELGRVRDSYQLSLLALRFAAPAMGEICSMDDGLLPYIGHLLKQHSALDLRHPALAVLEAYDRAHGSGLTETLYTFLKRNCGYVDTAEALFIHRSTLLYRLQRIQELTGLDLADYPTRLHVQLSFLIPE